MAHHRRIHPRGKHTRENSSEWRYPQIEEGSSKRGRVSAKRWALKFKDRLEQYYSVVEISN